MVDTRSGACRLLDAAKTQLRLSSDAALARAIGVPPPYVSKVRSGKMAVSDALLIRLHEETGYSIAVLKELMYASSISTQPAAGRPPSAHSNSAPHITRKQALAA